ncbi:alpha/beta hydrolase [Lutimaribacter sp. EGI FJ00015]|uniref:Alpha/beta hydrolase n=1 Tax=Lutimaribacter degradans TaxID=2945989 RepID=A0ACC5ZXW6_9RHOB|nr:alpha/beta hydrolase [Lutimaribacter sp. EGI FJ00013]MCM2563147.1 alpha/beta hydrolase [Lutimaribacter sp. EGI FJ00013]MCO0614326.1 alpha/beta hydrolase [Lutimaribacter sp. EGI FJ00015]MCO0637136.1 alpha/beta hydrolase [Lutimaribacter sp. EGI FJ00014]
MTLDATLDRAQIDEDYNARSTVSEAAFQDIIADYSRFSDQAAALFMEHAGVVYDPCGEKLDVLGAGGDGRPAVIFVHGGYWRALSRAHSRFMAPMLAARGVATVVPDYTLAPAVSLSEITRQVRAALAYVWHNAADLGIDRRRIFAVGSSAGGHLAACLAADGWQAAHDLPEQVLAGAMPISGLFELSPLARGHPQEWLNLTDAELDATSPMRHVPAVSCPMVVALAEHEAPGFVRQSQAYARAWSDAGHPVSHMVIPQRNHFDVILDLCSDQSALSAALLQMIGETGAHHEA